jgi:hypothetical protein
MLRPADVILEISVQDTNDGGNREGIQNSDRPQGKTSLERRGLDMRTSNALGGLVVIVLPIGPKVRGFKPGRGRWTSKGYKNP